MPSEPTCPRPPRTVTIVDKTIVVTTVEEPGTPGLVAIMKALSDDHDHRARAPGP